MLLVLPLLGCAMIIEPLDLESELDLEFSEPGAPTLVSVSPSYGLSTGGSSITITGRHFDPSAVVRFGGETGEVLQGVEDELIVRLPATDLSGLVDVEVETDGGKALLPDAFRFIADGEGRVGAVGYLEYSEHVGDYWSDAPAPTVRFSLSFVEPLSFHWQDTYALSVDQCQFNYTWDGQVDVIDLGLDSVELTGGGSSVTLPWSEESLFFESDLDASDFSFSTAYDFGQVSPDSFPSFGVAGIARTPSTSFTVTSPMIEGASVPTVSSAIPIAWSGGSGDVLLVTVGQRSSSGNDYAGVITCVVNNDGSFTIPDLWDSWPADRQIDFWFSMVRESSATLSFNGSSSGVVGMYSKAGAAFSD